MTSEKTDAIVVPADPFLSFNGGVAEQLMKFDIYGSKSIKS